MVLSYSYLFSTLNYLYMYCVIFGNIAVASFCTAFLLENFPTLSSLYIPLVSHISPIVQNILLFSSFISLLCFYFMLLYVRDHGTLLILFSLGFLFQLTCESLTVLNFFSGSNLLGIFAIYEHILVDLFNMSLFIPGNLLCFFSHHLSPT